MLKRLGSTLATALVATMLTSTGMAAAPAHAGGCDTMHEWSFTTTKGRTIWIPSSRSAGPFQWGGSQALTTADGQLNATTRGSADIVGGSAGADFKLVKAEVKYEHQWNRSTTVTNSFTKSFTTDSGPVARSVHWRWRMYHKGWTFTATRVYGHPSPCANGKVYTTKKRVILPVASRTYSFGIEKYRYRGWVLGADGKPLFKP